MQYHIPTLESIPFVVTDFLEKFKDKRIFAFYAEMGSGKTTFILHLLRSMGIENPEGSPTYSIVNTYESPYFGKIFHFDLYRLNDLEEAYDVGIEEILYDDKCISFIEWPEVIESLLPEDVVRVKILLNSENERYLEIE
jgi:tRNA threonylcarbamoyladenosine biosynthesis protein TsaE